MRTAASFALVAVAVLVGEVVLVEAAGSEPVVVVGPLAVFEHPVERRATAAMHSESRQLRRG